MAIIRVVKNENPFAQIDKAPLEDPKLSFKAKGILAYLLSKPDDWKLQVADLENHSNDGERSIYSGIKELRQNGYCQIIKKEIHSEKSSSKNTTSLSIHINKIAMWLKMKLNHICKIAIWLKTKLSHISKTAIWLKTK